MNAEQDDTSAWFDALAGIGPAANSADEQMISAVRSAADRIDDARIDKMALKRLLNRLESEGLLASRRSRWQQWAPGLATAAVIILAVGVMLEWSVFRPYPQEMDVIPEFKTERAAPSSAESLRSEDESLQLKESYADTPTPESGLQSSPSGTPQKKTAPHSRARERATAPREPAYLMDDARKFSADSSEAERRVEPIPALVFSVQEPAEAYRALDQLASQTHGLYSEPDHTRARTVTCISVESCRVLRDWLEQHDPERELPAENRIRVTFSLEKSE